MRTITNTFRFNTFHFIVSCGLYLGLAWLTMADAEPITVELPSKIVANADYRPGQADKPAVLMLHGFMATYQLNIIQTMAGELESQGFSVLAPTLSLRINNRQQGGNCEAIHTHTMATDEAEIRWWINWLQHKGYHQVIALGFSTGGMQLAALLASHVPNVVKKAVFVSPVYMTGPPFPLDIDKADLQKAKTLQAHGDIRLERYSLSYCKENFVAPAKVLLSYKVWTRQRLLDTLKSISIPAVIIVGGGDMRFGKQWVDDLSGTGKRVVVIPEANHFFNAIHEFDFLEKLVDEVNRT